jgi:hypothetical protein
MTYLWTYEAVDEWRAPGRHRQTWTYVSFAAWGLVAQG